MSRGYVYILTNEAMPGLVKIGKTTRSVEQRAAELTHTGIPFPFDVVAQAYSPDCSELEQWVHGQLSDCRVNTQREFFLCDVLKAERILEQAHREQVTVWLQDFLPDHIIERSEMTLDTSVPCIMATHVDLHPVQVIDAYSYMLPQEMAPAIKRMQDHISGVKKMEWLRPADGFDRVPE